MPDATAYRKKNKKKKHPSILLTFSFWEGKDRKIQRTEKNKKIKKICLCRRETCSKIVYRVVRNNISISLWCHQNALSQSVKTDTNTAAYLQVVIQVKKMTEQAWYKR